MLNKCKYMRTSNIHISAGSAPGTPKLPQLPVRTPQKIKATVANIPVGSYEGGGRGKEREKNREREREKERENTGANSRFSFELERPGESASPSQHTHTAEEPPSSDRPPVGHGPGDNTDTCSTEASNKEVREREIDRMDCFGFSSQ